MFPSAIEELLHRFGVAADTRAGLYDLYVALGSDAIQGFGLVAESVGGPHNVRPEDLAEVKPRVVDWFLERNHPSWLAGKPTPSLWHPREVEGRASGVLVPSGRLGVAKEKGDLAKHVEEVVRSLVGPRQPAPAGILIFGKNAHFGGRPETISFDVVEEDLDGAFVLARAEGRQHTVPGSVGETSGTLDATRRLALLWEVQPNVLKPSGSRNREASALVRRHRNWHVTTLVFALEWLMRRQITVWVIRGAALEPAHQVNPNEPISGMIGDLHDRTVRRVVEGMGGALAVPDVSDSDRILDSELPNTGLRRFIEREGARSAAWRVEGIGPRE